MTPNIKRPLVFLDIESAVRNLNPDPAVDKIVHLAVSKFGIHNVGNAYLHRFNPGFKMSQENIDCHGITNEEASTYPFMDKPQVESIIHFMNGCDIVGFNHTNYDVPLMWEEFFRVKVDWQTEEINFIDVGTIFKLKEERSLKAAMKFYCGREHDGAHDAMEDVNATVEVFRAQMQRYPDLGQMTAEELAVASRYDERVDLAGKIIKGPDGDPVYNFGKNRGQKVVENEGYAYWMLDRDFSENTKRALRKILGIGKREAALEQSDMPWHQG